MIYKGLYLSSERIKTELDLLFKNSDTQSLLKDWTAEVLDLCNPVNIHNFYQYSDDDVSREEVEFRIRLNDNLSNNEILILLIISYYLPSSGSFLLRDAIETIEKKKKLHMNISYKIYSSGLPSILCYLHCSNLEWRSMKGQIVRMLKRIKNNYNTIVDFNSQSIFQPFFTQPHYDKVERYSGYTKHYKDHGSLQPDLYAKINHLSDDEWMQLYLNSIEQKKQQFKDTLEFIFGMIQ